MAFSQRHADSVPAKRQVHIPVPIMLLEPSDPSTDVSVAQEPVLPSSAATASIKKRKSCRAPVTFEYQAHFEPAKFLQTLDSQPRDVRKPLLSHRAYTPESSQRGRSRPLTRDISHCASALSVLEQSHTVCRKAFRSLRRKPERSPMSARPDTDSAASLCIGKDLPEVKKRPKSPTVPHSLLQIPVMEYYRRLSQRPERGIRTPNTNQKRVASNSGYRTKWQKDPVLRRSALGRYEYQDCYDLDEAYLRKLHSAVNARRRIVRRCDVGIIMQEEPTQLRDLIKEVRACKTAAEERAVIGEESAKIRNSFRDDRCAFRHRSVTKLLFIQMMGYQTHFGQVECLKLIASQDFTEKRVGYLGLTQLLNEKDDVLMMVTNHIQMDMQSTNNQVSVLALTALANVGTADMCRDLAKNVETLLLHSNSFIRKKANLAAVRIIRKCPELNEDFARHLSSILEDRNHGVLLTAVTLMLEICRVNPDQIREFRQYTQSLTRALKNLLLSGYSPEHDISGITDPFLQVTLLQMLRLLGHKDRTASDEMNDTLAQLATNTECTKNTGNSILYECVKVILDIEASSGLRVLAVNIMGRFLLNRDNNIRYVALNTLHKLVALDVAAVQRHKTTITECLRDQDGVIRRKALDLTIAITNESNVKTIVKELLDYLLAAEADFKDILVSKICLVVELFSPNKKWHIDTIIRILTLAGRFVPEESIATTAHLVAATSELQTYTVHKLYHAVRENTGSTGLIQLAVWAIGEYGSMLVGQSVQGPEGSVSQVSEEELCQYVGELLASRPSDVTRQYILTAVVKLTVRMPASRAKLLDILSTETTAMSAEIQQRACEYVKLLETSWDRYRAALLEPIPALKQEKGEAQPVADDDEGVAVIKAAPKTLAQNILDIDLLLSEPEQTQAKPAEERPAVAAPSLDDIFGTSTPILNAFQQAPAAPAAETPPADVLTITAIQDAEITVKLHCSKQDPSSPQTTTVDAVMENASDRSIAALKLLVAVPKHLQLTMSSPPATSMGPGEQIVQAFRLLNTQHGSKALMLKLKCDFVLAGEPRSKQTTVSSFPDTY